MSNDNASRKIQMTEIPMDLRVNLLEQWAHKTFGSNQTVYVFKRASDNKLFASTTDLPDPSEFILWTLIPTR